MKLNEILSPSIRQVQKTREQMPPIWQQRQSADSDFCRAVVSNGYMTEEQMQEAVGRYRLGCSRDGGVIFWQIDTLGHEYDGKIMYYRPDCHRDHQRHPQWVSNLLKRQFVQRFPEMAAWMPETHHCLFGTHLLATHPHPLPVWRGVVSPYAEDSLSKSIYSPPSQDCVPHSYL